MKRYRVTFIREMSTTVEVSAASREEAELAAAAKLAEAKRPRWIGGSDSEVSTVQERVVKTDWQAVG